MKSLSEYLAYYDPMRESNERYLPEDQATLRYSRVSVIADGKVIGASLYPDHVLDLAFLETPFMRQLCRDYQYARKLKVRIECYEHSGEGESRGLVAILHGSAGFEGGVYQAYLLVGRMTDAQPAKGSLRK